MSYKLLRPLLFHLDPERAHRLALTSLGWLGSQAELREAIARALRYEDPRLEQGLFGLRFKNPLGLAAGFDKDARAVAGLAALGFGFLEVGSVSAWPSPGNPQPRIFRLPQDKAIINRLGIPSVGAARVATRLAQLGNRGLPLGVNLNFTTRAELSREEIIADYRYSLRRLYPCADYLAINLSCPNLPEVEFTSTEPDDLEALLRSLAEERRRLRGGKKPLLVKLSGDLSDEELDRVLEVTQRYVDGFIAVNTTTSREGLRTQDRRLIAQEGGLSGQPLRRRATETISHIYRRTDGKLPIIGVGGVFSAKDAWEKLRAGASLVEIYTGLIYEGPGIVKRIKRGLVRLLEEHGYRSIAEAIGSGVRL